MKLIFLFLLFPLFVFGQEQVHFSLPINWTSDVHYNLEVTIPDNFISLQPMDEWEKSDLIEFVPKGETGEKWSEIITINKFLGQKIPADQFISRLKEGIFSKATNVKVWNEKTEKMPNFTQADLSLSYDYRGKHEILIARYFSGPFDCVGVQYTIRSDGTELDDDILSRIEIYSNSNVKVRVSE